MVGMRITLHLREFCCLGLALVFAPNASLAAKVTPTSGQALAAPSAGQRKLIALTFDDGPKPYVLMGRQLQNGATSPGLLDLLDREGVKATFFVMGFRLADSADKFCRQTDVGINCRQAAEPRTLLPRPKIPGPEAKTEYHCVDFATSVDFPKL